MYKYCKPNGWVRRTIQMMRLSTSGSSGSFDTPDKVNQKASDKQNESKEIPIEGFASNEQDIFTRAPTPSTFAHTESPSTLADRASTSYESAQAEPQPMHPTYAPQMETPASTQHIMVNNEINKEQKRTEREIVECLRSYFNDQIAFYRTMANNNKAAMKRMKKLRKEWTNIVK